MATVAEIKGTIAYRQAAAQKSMAADADQINPNTQNTLAQGQEGYIARYITEDGADIELSPSVVLADLLIGDGQPTMKEVMSYIKLCEFNRLNPYLKEAYIIKWASSKQAKVFVGKDVFFKRADKYPEYDGMESGLYVIPYGASDFIERPDSFYVFNGDDEKNDRIVGAYAKVYRKDRKFPTYCAISYGQHALYKNPDTGTWEQNKTWARMPASMASKVAKVRALREAFPNNFSGMYIAEEIMDSQDIIEEESVTQKGSDGNGPPQVSRQNLTHFATGSVLSKENDSNNIVSMNICDNGLLAPDFAVNSESHTVPTSANTSVTKPNLPANNTSPAAVQGKSNQNIKSGTLVTREQRKKLGDVFNKNIDLCTKFVNEMGYKKSDQIKAVDFDKIYNAALEAAKRPEYANILKSAV